MKAPKTNCQGIVVLQKACIHCILGICIFVSSIHECSAVNAFYKSPKCIGFQNEMDPDSVIPSSRFRHELGLSLGTTSGYGLGYRLWSGRIGGQIVGAPFKNTVISAYNVGMTFLYYLVRTNIFQFLLYQSNQYINSNEYFSNNLYPVSRYYGSSFRNRYWSHGIGMGFEIYRPVEKANPLGITFMTGLGSYRDFTAANLTAEISVMYKFRK